MKHPLGRHAARLVAPLLLLALAPPARTQVVVDGHRLQVDSRPQFEQGQTVDVDIEDEGIALHEVSAGNHAQNGIYTSPVYDLRGVAIWEDMEVGLDYRGVDLVPNPGFEEDADQDEIPDTWTVYGGGGGIDPTGPDGNALVLTTASAQVSVRSAEIPIESNRVYVLSNDLKIDHTRGAFYVQIRLFDSSRNELSCCNTLLHGKYQSSVPDFERHRYTFDMREYEESAAFLQVIYKWYASDGASGSAWVDNVQLLERPSLNVATRTSLDSTGWSAWSDDYDYRFPAQHNGTIRSVPIPVDSTQSYTLKNRLRLDLQEGDFYVQINLLHNGSDLLSCCHTLQQFDTALPAYVDEVYTIDMADHDPRTRYIQLVYKWWNTTTPPLGTAWIDDIELTDARGVVLYDDKDDDSHTIVSPQGRYLQFRATLASEIASTTPVLRSVSIPFHPATEFRLPWDDDLPTVVSSDLLDAPAGHRGVLTVGEDGHFRFEDGTRARFWGVQMFGPGNFPSHDHAERIVGRLAKLGFNAIKMQIDRNSGEGSIFDQGYDDTRHLDAGKLDRLDYLIAEAKELGIYTYMRLHSTRGFKPGDEVEAIDEVHPPAKYLTMFDRRLIDLQLEYATQLLGHLNPYTGLTYAEDPAIALVETTNENSIFSGWRGAELDGEVLSGGYEIPLVYAQQLDRRWNAWLQERYVDDATLLPIWDDGTGTGLEPGESLEDSSVVRILFSQVDTYSQARVSDLARFYHELERDYFLEMKAHVQETLGSRALVVGSNNMYGMPALKSQNTADFIDVHGYWDLPSPSGQHDRPMVTEGEERVTIEVYSASRIGGKPMTISEWNAPLANRFESELPLINAAYMSFHDWDGAFLFQYNTNDDWGDADAQYIDDPLGESYNPSAMAQMAVASRLFLRGDVLPATTTIELSYTDAETFSSMIEFPRGIDDYAVRGGLPSKLCLLHKVEKVSFEAATQRDRSSYYAQYGLTDPVSPFVSDTGELVWDTDAGLFTVNSRLTQAAVGFLGSREVDLDNVRLNIESGFASVSLSSLDHRDLASSGSMLLVAVGRTENYGIQYSSVEQPNGERRKQIADWGSMPVLSELIEGEVRLKRSGVEVHILDETGARTGQLFTTAQGDDTLFELDRTHGTLWYELVGVTPTYDGGLSDPGSTPDAGPVDLELLDVDPVRDIGPVFEGGTTIDARMDAGPSTESGSPDRAAADAQPDHRALPDTSQARDASRLSDASPVKILGEGCSCAAADTRGHVILLLGLLGAFRRSRRASLPAPDRHAS